MFQGRNVKDKNEPCARGANSARVGPIRICIQINKLNGGG